MNKPISIELQQLPKEVQALVDKDKYTAATWQLEDTTFYIVSRKNGGLGQERICKALQDAWPKWRKLLPVKMPDSTIIDYDAAIGGGPMANFIVGVFTTASISQDFGKVVELSTGWPPLPSTQAYISKHYSGFDEPLQAYTTDMVTHELGHLYFGYGLTTLPNLKDKDAWLGLGLGLVYDRLVWDQLYKQPSPLFEGIISLWRERFSRRSDLDQRLVNPDTSKDEAAGLQRLQTYGHGKAFVYLHALRNHLGTKAFDATVLRYISQKPSRRLNYDEFVAQFTPDQQKLLKKVETEYNVR